MEAVPREQLVRRLTELFNSRGRALVRLRPRRWRRRAA